MLLTLTVDAVVFTVFLLQIPIVYYGFQHFLNGKNAKLSKMSAELQTLRAKGNKDIKSIVGNADILVQNGGKSSLGYAARTLHKTFSYERKANSYAMSVCTVLEYLHYLTINGMNVYIVILFAANKINISDMVFLNLLNNLYYNCMSSLTDIQGKLLELRSSLSFVEDEIIDHFSSEGTLDLSEVSSISAEGLTIGYDDIPLVENARFSIKAGDIIGVRGASGQGKSTLMKMIAGMIPCEQIKNK